MRKFFRFSEANNWEGELWRFYIPIAGNEEAHGKLLDYCKSKGGHYEIEEELFLEDEVDILVKHTDSGYMKYHNKLDIVLDISKVEQIISSEEELLYKGGIRELG